MSESNVDATAFLNVDFIIYSQSNLQTLVDALGNKVIVMHVSKVKRTFEAHLELSGSCLPSSSYQISPDSLILKFCKLIDGLPPEARELWDTAKLRIFDVGIATPNRNMFYSSTICEKAIKASAAINAQITLTVYGPMKTVGKRRGTAPVAKLRRVIESR